MNNRNILGLVALAALALPGPNFHPASASEPPAREAVLDMLMHTHQAEQLPVPRGKSTDTPPFLIDASPVIVEITSNVSDLTLDWILPDGTALSEAAMKTAGASVSRRTQPADEPAVVPMIAADRLPPGWTRYQIHMPTSAWGQHKLRVTRPQEGREVAIAIVSLSQPSSVRVGSTVSQDPVLQGAKVAVGVMVAEDGAQVVTAQVTAELAQPGGGLEAITFRDDGVAPDRAQDGMFTALVDTAGRPAGRYEVGFEVSGTASNGRQFRRTGNASFEILSRFARFAGPIDGCANGVPGACVDFAPPDASGRPDGLRLRAAVEALEACLVRVDWTLRTPAGQSIGIGTLEELEPGVHMIDQFIDHEWLRHVGENGPFTVTKVALYGSQDSSDILLERTAGVPFPTPAFTRADLAGPPIDLRRNIECFGVNTNDPDSLNPPYSYFRVNVPIWVRHGGTYHFYARLRQGDAYVADALGTTNLIALRDDQFITLDFPAEQIRAAGRDSPWRITDLSIGGAWNGAPSARPEDLDFHLGAEPIFPHSHFLAVGRAPSDPGADHGADNTFNDLYRRRGIDFNRDDAVNPDDLNDFLAAFFLGPLTARLDFNGDGLIKDADISAFFAVYNDYLATHQPTKK